MSGFDDFRFEPASALDGRVEIIDLKPLARRRAPAAPRWH